MEPNAHLLYYVPIVQKLNKIVYQTDAMTLLGDFGCAENRTGGAASRFLKWLVSRGFGDVTSFIGANGFFFSDTVFFRILCFRKNKGISFLFFSFS